MNKILVTGGAGFIGTHLCRTLVDCGWEVTVLDNLNPQIHGPRAVPNLPKSVRFIDGDVCCTADVAKALYGQEVVVHLAAETGTGQSMYELLRYEHVNMRGAAVVMHQIAQMRPSRVQKVVVASSRSVYGEGSYWCDEHGVVYPRAREASEMALRHFECRCPVCGEFCRSIPTTENCPFNPSSYYGITKQAQEQTVLLMANVLGISGYGLRYQNVYGPGQSLKNPYTGILAVFTNLARAGQKITLFEDGLESRDFVYVQDVVDATLLCINDRAERIDRFNVGGGERVTVSDVADAVVDYFASDSPIEVSGEFRLGDIRHNLADLSYIRGELNYLPKWRFADGVVEFLNWASLHEPADFGFSRSLEELKARGLLVNASLK
jgi:dTDP-L-rhamnose 4-epimerase